MDLSTRRFNSRSRSTEQHNSTSTSKALQIVPPTASGRSKNIDSSMPQMKESITAPKAVIPVHQGMLNKCIKQNTHKPVFPSTRDAYQLKKKLNGLIIGTLDKNKGELSLVCPTLYYEALVNIYNDEAGYRRVHIAKLSTYRKQRYSNAQLPEQIIRETGLPRNQRGTQKDIVKMWERIYKEKGWRRYAQYNTQGDLINHTFYLRQRM